MKKTFQKFRFTQLKIVSILFFVLVALILFAFLRDNTEVITHEQANMLYSEDKITKIVVEGKYLLLHTQDNVYKVYKYAINYKKYFEKFPVELKEESHYLGWFFFALITLMLFALFYRFKDYLKKGTSVESLRAGFTNQGNEAIEAISSSVRFSDVAGIKDVKEELEEIIDFLKNPKKYKSLDIKLPKGVLLIGPPGVGKTMISKAVAGEAGVPFFYQSGASFAQIYVGMGAKRVRNLFAKAKQMAPSIVFIDEIDAVGKSRGNLRNDEREATLNQLLTEMDGFEENSGVIVIAATNKVEVLDEALLRAGRFDRRIYLSLPDIEERTKTLELYLKHKNHNVDINQLAKMTAGFNFAAIDTLVNEAALHALRKEKKIVEIEDFEAVKDKVILGKKRLLVLNEKEMEVQAVYQAAKALVATWLDIEFDRIGIFYNRFLASNDDMASKNQLLNRIKVYLAGTAATKKYYGENFVNSSSDIKEAKALAQRLTFDLSMGDKFFSDAKESEDILQASLDDAASIIEKLASVHKNITGYLLENESITQEETREMLREIF